MGAGTGGGTCGAPNNSTGGGALALLNNGTPHNEKNSEKQLEQLISQLMCVANMSQHDSKITAYFMPVSGKLMLSVLVKGKFTKSHTMETSKVHTRILKM